MAETEELIVNEQPLTVEQTQDQQEQAQQQDTEKQEQERLEKLQTFIESGKSFDEDIEELSEQDKAKEKEVAVSAFDEFISASPLNKAFVEWSKSGGSDFNDFMEQVGYKQSATDIDALLTAEIKNDPLIDATDADEITAELEKRKDKFELLSDKKKESFIKNLKQKHNKAQDNVYEQYSEKVQQRNAKIDEIRNNAIADVQKTIESFAGKKVFNNLVSVLKEDVEELQNLAALYTPQMVDEKTGLPKYDIKQGIKTALKIRYFDTAIKEALKSASAMGKVATMKERIAPDAGQSTVTGSSAGSIEDGLKRIREQAMKR